MNLIDKIDELATQALFHFMLPTGIALNPEDFEEYKRQILPASSTSNTFNSPVGALTVYVKPSGAPEILVDADRDLNFTERMKAFRYQTRNGLQKIKDNIDNEGGSK